MFLWVIVEVLVDFFRASNDSNRASEFHVSACEAIVHLHVKKVGRVLAQHQKRVKKVIFFSEKQKYFSSEISHFALR